MTFNREDYFQVGNKKVLDAYHNQDNYLIECNKESTSNKCVIYFSSNGLYYPNTESAFTKVVLKNNRYDWRNRNKIRDAKKHIFLRDIFKQFYLEGVNSTINSIDKMLEFLKKETQGMQITTVGSSSGGYAAILFGEMLKAEQIYAFSPIVDIDTALDDEDDYVLYPLVYENRDDSQKNKYYDITALARSSKAKIFVFLAGNSNYDLKQKELVEGVENIHIYMLKTKHHSTTLYNFNKLLVLETPPDVLIEQLSDYRDQKVSQFRFSIRVSGIGRTLLHFFREKSWYLFALLRFLFWFLPYHIYSQRKHRVKKKPHRS